MKLIQQKEKPSVLSEVTSFSQGTKFTTKNWLRIVGLLTLILGILCVTIALFYYKLELSCIFGHVNHANPPTIRQTLNGPVEGIEQTTALGQKYYSFRGIPFAEPPITGTDPYTGEQVDRRFKPPIPFKRNWTEVLKAHDFNKLCQPSETELRSGIGNYSTSEDCLTMNLFVPAGGAEKKPVFVYIHGGGPGGGITDLLMGPDFLLAHDNVVVYLTFRVQIFGFLNLGFGDYTGNMALKDQQLGMKWVYDNIEFFSGNRNQIMLFGDSIGSSCVHAHVLNAESKKYFNRAYMVSGTLNLWDVHRNNHLAHVRICLNFNGTDMGLVEYLKTANSEVLASCNDLPWVLHIESPNATEPFLTKTPEEIYDSDEAFVDAMFTFTSQESIEIFPTINMWTNPLHANWRASDLQLPYENFSYYSHPNEYQRMMDMLKEAYYPTNASDIDEVRRVNIAYMSDIMVSDNVLKSVALHADANTRGSDKSQHKKTYLVRVSMHSDLNAMETQYKINYTGATHSDDLCYMFYCGFLSEFNVTEPHIINRDHVYDMVMRNVERMSNFARYGDPSLKGDTPFKSTQSSNEIYCHEISNDPKTRITTDIKQQLKYDVWRKMDDIYNNLYIN